MLGVFAGPSEMVHSKFCTRVERVEKSQLGGLIAEHSPSVITTGIYLLGVLCKEPPNAIRGFDAETGTIASINDLGHPVETDDNVVPCFALPRQVRFCIVSILP